MKLETFTGIEYSFRKKEAKREEFLEIMDGSIPWEDWAGVIEPYYPKGKRERPPMGTEKRNMGHYVQKFPYPSEKRLIYQAETE